MLDIIGFKPYMMHCAQQFYDKDTDLLCVEMSERLIPILEDLTNQGHVFVSDESNFYVSRMVNEHNCRIWAANNPFMIIEAAMNSSKINV